MATGQKTEFTVNAKDKTKRGLASAQRNLNKTSKEADRLAGRFRSVARATVVMEGPLGGTAGRLSAIATMMNSVNAGTIAFGVGLTAVTAVAYKSLSAFSQWESQTLKINQLLEQTGGASGLAASEIEDMAVRIGRSTLASADDVRAASAVLLSFKSIATDAFERTLDVASDLAALTGQDLKQSVIQLGKALEDPATGMSALRRSGVSFTNSQKDMIVAMKESGDAAGAQAEILAMLEGQLGGAGAAAGGGLAGAADLVGENWNLMLIKLADTGAGKLATDMLNGIASAIENIGNSLRDDEDINVRREKVMRKLVNTSALIAELEDKSTRTKDQEALLEIYKKSLLHRGNDLALLVKEKDESVAAARAKGEVAREELKKTAAAELLVENQKKVAKEAESKFKKDTKAAAAYGQKLIDEEQKYQSSLLTKGQQEDVFLEDRLTKISDNLANELITKADYHAQEQAAFALHNAKITEIHRTEKEKQAEDEEKINELQLAATQSALSDISGMMSGQSRKLFELGKASAIANALVNTYQAVTKTMSATPYPWNIPLAAAQGLAGMVQVQKIKQQKMAAREFGGPVIAGRSYLVGERGPELFTAPRTGQIINNATTSNVGGQSNTFNITNVLENDEAFIQRNTVKIWDSIIDKMNEEGLRFS